MLLELLLLLLQRSLLLCLFLPPAAPLGYVQGVQCYLFYGICRPSIPRRRDSGASHESKRRGGGGQVLQDLVLEPVAVGKRQERGSITDCGRRTFRNRQTRCEPNREVNRRAGRVL